MTDTTPRDWMPPMDPDIKRKWVDALRSGEYKQGRGRLHNYDADTYCCLGVLCDLAVKEGIAESRRTPENVYSAPETLFGKGMDWAADLLPNVVKQWAGIPKAAPFVLYTNYTNYTNTLYQTPTWVRLSHLNDAEHLTFDQIATLIERSI